MTAKKQYEKNAIFFLTSLLLYGIVFSMNKQSIKGVQMKTLLLHNKQGYEIVVGSKHVEMSHSGSSVLVQLSEKRWKEVKHRIGDYIYADIDGKTYPVIKYLARKK